MKKLLVSACIFCCAHLAIAQDNPFHFYKDHDARMVKDLKRSAQFYHDILGLKEIYNAGLGDKRRWFELGDHIQLHLLETDEEIKPNKSNHMAIHTDKIDDFIAFLKKKNIYFENWTGEANTTTLRPDGKKQIYIQDPDGNWIEINDNSF
ncbi:VOC family protein [Zhouia sp. PK063]|uniref:VOC family protein n=1 Tax=Zhouia sp. PK063 TaxID=3373602 RepID=UPI0037A06D3C